MIFKNILLDEFINLDKKTKKIMHSGFVFSFIVCIISVIILFTYEAFYNIPILFYAGISLLHSALMFGCAFIIFGIAFDTIKKQIE